MTTSELASKNILIIGLGREGLSSYHFLRNQLPDQVIYLADEKTRDDLNPEWQKIIAQDLQVRFAQIASYQPQELPTSENLLVVKTAGLPKSKLAAFNWNNAIISSNTQLFFDLVSLHPNLKIIGVTGTKGKSTTTSVIYHVLKSNGLKTFIGGNIGKPPLNVLAEVDDLNQDAIIVLELSSHQLAELTISPHIAVIQAIAEEHLDYYHSINDYAQAKAQITLHQTSDDWLIFNQDNELVKNIAAHSLAHQLPFGLDAVKQIVEPVLTVEEVPLPGQFNLYNIMPAILIGQQYGLSNQQIKQAIKSFKSLPHRLELVAEIQGVKYFNDSLATNPHATIRALEAFADRSIILIAGGYDRGLDYGPLADKILSSQVKELILFPTTGERIKQEIEQRGMSHADHHSDLKSHLVEVNSMSEAVKIAHEKAKNGEVVLMSPASASFNLFKDYADRGEQFRKEVNKLI